jgi:hypothetical protein
VIVIEDLNVSGMVRNRHMARVISACGWGEFGRQLAYKCERYGRRLVIIDRWYPSSKTCSECGHLLADLSLSTRHWRCPSCGARHDRDINAAKNILAAGHAAARGYPGDACGADVRHSGSSRVRSAVKQEPRSARTGIPSFRAGSSQGHGMSASSLVPAPGGLSTRSTPPADATRSASPASPEPRSGLAPPAPSSLTRTASRPGSLRMLTWAVLALACLATLASASLTTK